MGDMLERIRAALGTDARFTWVPGDFLDAQGVKPWSDMPAWLPPTGEAGGLMRTSIDRALAAGLTFRPIEETARDALAWFRALPQERQAAPRAGLAADREASVLAAWHAAARA